MATREPEGSAAENRISCSCRSTCSTKRSNNATNSNRGCPCKTEGLTCTDQCSCGSSAKPCRNKPGAARPATQPRSNTYQTSNERPTEEEERIKENRDVKDFIETLDANMVKRLCIRSLRRGVGSMDYIQSLLIMEDDLDDDVDEYDTGDTSTSTSAVQDSVPQQDPEIPHESASPQWCKCRRCRVMPQEVENKCCGQRRCVTSHTRFTKLCLDPDVLQLAIRNRGDIRNDREDNSTRSFRKAAYRQYVLDRYGHLGKGNRKVCPSCVVVKVRHHYPSQTGVYMGFRPE